MPARISDKERKWRKTVKKIERIEAEDDPLVEIPSTNKGVQDLDMVSMVMKVILKGGNVEDVRDALFDAGMPIGVNRAQRIIAAAKKQIILLGEKDMAVNYGWAQQNLMEMHLNAVRNNDTRTRGAVIKQLIELWQLNKPHEEIVEFAITPEMIEEYESKLLR